MNKLTISVVMIAALLGSVAGAAFAAGGGEGGAVEGPTPFRVYRPGNTIDPETDPVLQEMQRRLNIEIEIITVPWGETMQKAQLVMQSGEPLEMVHFQAFNAPIVEWARDGLYYQLDDHANAADHPYITKVMNDPALAPTDVDGEHYFIPNVETAASFVLAVRQDWLDKLGLALPANLDQFRDMLAAFTRGDPDGSGKADTVGLQHESILRTFEPVGYAYGVSNWRMGNKPMHVANGKVVHELWTDGFREALRYMNELFREGLINEDFPLQKNHPALSSTYFYPGKAGVMWGPYPFVNNIQAVDPSQVSAIPPFEAVPGYERVGNRGIKHRQFIAFPTTGANIAKTLQVFEYMVSREGRQLMIAGVPGVHWTGSVSDDGLFDRNQEAWDADYQAIGHGGGVDHPLFFDWFTGVHGYTPIEQYSTFAEAVANNQIWADRGGFEGKFWNNKNGFTEGARFAGHPAWFTFVEIESVGSIQAELDQALSVAWQKMVRAGSAAEFEQEWAAYQKEFRRIGIEQYIAAYQQYYDDHLR